MKYISLLLAVCFFLPLLGGEPGYCKLSDRIVKDFAKKYFEKYGLVLDGSGGGFMGDIYLIDLHLSTDESHSVSDAREIYVEMMEDLLKLYNRNVEIRPYLHNYPFNLSNIHMGLRFPKSTLIFRSENVSYMSVINDEIYYYTRSLDTDKLVDLHQEPYADALEIVRGHAK